ncbi:MAG TPA: CcmD family protein [Terriglobales bacterium]|nr:CcmD family protein [Terriglobales bacterium]
MKFLYAAYILTWVVHIGYLLSLGQRVKRLREEFEEKK